MAIVLLEFIRLLEFRHKEKKIPYTVNWEYFQSVEEMMKRLFETIMKKNVPKEDYVVCIHNGKEIKRSKY